MRLLAEPANASSETEGMETNRRTLAKAVTYQLMGLAVMTLLGTLFTGSAGAGGALALISAAIGAFGYVVHERLWARVRWGQRLAEGEAGAAAERVALPRG